MRRTVTLPFLTLTLFLFCWINLPKSLSDSLRSLAITPFRSNSQPEPHELSRLQVENQSLRTQLDHVYDWLLFDQQVKGEFSQNRSSHLRELLSQQLSSLPAHVIYRDPSSWSSTIWVNVGEESNEAIGQTLIGKNSPVLADGALVGVVDYVGRKQARIRLITDSGLSPSVRVCRGGTQNRELAHRIQALLNQLEKRSELAPLVLQLQKLKEESGPWEDGYLAKGEVHGSSAPFWRSRSPMLKGIGFNFDYPDKEGFSQKGAPILKEGDLLVTSGLDGVFPAGLRVGTVTGIDPLQEGGYAYDIQVRPAVTHLNDLQTVFILPPQRE